MPNATNWGPLACARNSWIAPISRFLILSVGFNDINQCLLNANVGPAHSENFRLFPAHKPLWLNSRLLFLLSCKINALAGRQLIGNDLNALAYDSKAAKPEHPSPPALARFREELKLLVSLPKRDGVDVLVVLQDCNAQVEWAQREIFLLVREEIRQVCEHLGVYHVDMAEVSRSEPKYFADLLHMNEEGNRLRGQYLAGVVRELLDSRPQSIP
ncbi:MAG: SGNH/GDSL hydrolase family protein [Lentisphaerales bacterium]|nr:MAG: SGNH/GDSL hydrolase family protein [Lentisphaerales bacterium]